LYERARLVMPNGNTRTTLFVQPHPLMVSRGKGFEIEDVDGQRMIDLHGNYTTLVHGHGHPAITRAAIDALHDGASFGMQTEADVALAEAIVERVDAIERIRFTNSGSEAVMMALRAARAHTGRTHLLRFDGCYHGIHDAFVGERAPGVTPGVTGEVITVPIDLDAFERAVDAHAGTLAAVIIDLMPNRAGLTPMPEELVRAVRARTEAHGIVMIVDEVITFRMARGGLQQRFGVRPDLVTLGKVIGGGFPVGAFGGRAEIMNRFDPSLGNRVDHAGTFTANPVTMRAGRAAVDLLDEDAIARINGLGDVLRPELADMGFDARGAGSLLRVVSDDPAATWWAFAEEGLAIANNGLMAMSTAMDEDTVAEVVERAARAAARLGLRPGARASAAG
jgi:glutamate-1-semialdehyde 2,1-aminomutase